MPDGPVSRWAIPSWLRETGLTYHSNPHRWPADGILQSVARGQEFISDIAGIPEAATWLRRVLSMIQTGTTENPSDE